MGPGGNVFYQERDKDLIKVGGENVSAREVEDVVTTVAGVAQAAVVGKKHEWLDQVVVAFVITAPGAPGPAELEREAIAACTEKLAEFKVPVRCTWWRSSRSAPSTSCSRTSCGTWQTNSRRCRAGGAGVVPSGVRGWWRLPLDMRAAVSLDIDAAPDKVSALVSDIARMGEYSPEVVEAEWIDGATGPAVGARYRGHVRRNENWPVLYWTTCEVTESAPGETFEFVVVMGGRPLNRWRYEFIALAEGRTRVTESFDLGDHVLTRLWRPLGGFLRENRNRTGHAADPRAGEGGSRGLLAVPGPDGGAALPTGTRRSPSPHRCAERGGARRSVRRRAPLRSSGSPAPSDRPARADGPGGCSVTADQSRQFIATQTRLIGEPLVD